MKILCVGDVHGRYESLLIAIDRFSTVPYDRLVLLGDIADSWDRSDDDIMKCYDLILSIKQQHSDKVIWLWGNHDWQYQYGKQMCRGYRPTLNMTLQPWLVENRGLLQIAHLEEGCLFTHAGIQKPWYDKYQSDIETIAAEYGTTNNIADTLNIMAQMGRYTEIGSISVGWSVQKGPCQSTDHYILH